MSGRYFADGKDRTENYDSKGYIDFSVAKFGVCHKSEKVNPTTSETIGISGVTDKVNWPTLVDGPSYIARKSSVLFPPTRANIKSEKAGELPGIYYSWELSQTRTSLVDREHKAIQWQKNSTAGTSNGHPNRCF